MQMKPCRYHIYVTFGNIIQSFSWEQNVNFAPECSACYLTYFWFAGLHFPSHFDCEIICAHHQQNIWWKNEQLVYFGTKSTFYISQIATALWNSSMWNVIQQIEKKLTSLIFNLKQKGFPVILIMVVMSPTFVVSSFNKCLLQGTPA